MERTVKLKKAPTFQAFNLSDVYADQWKAIEALEQFLNTCGYYPTAYTIFHLAPNDTNYHLHVTINQRDYHIGFSNWLIYNEEMRSFTSMSNEKYLSKYVEV